MEIPRQTSKSPPWFTRAWFIRTITYGFILLVLIKFIHSVFIKTNDFDVHLAYGQLALQGTLGNDEAAFQALLFHYPPGRILIDEALALLPRLWARGFIFAAAIASLFMTRAIWRELATSLRPASPEVEFAASSLAFVLIAPWVVRDLDECGLQILLLFFLSMAARSLYRGARIHCGAWLGLAITFKLTPILFVPLLIWKRRFVEAGATVCFVLAFNVLVPIFVWGPALTHDALTRHLSLVHRSATLEDPAENGVETPKHNNQSLKFAIARYLQTYPRGHPLFIDRNYDGRGCIDRGIPPDRPDLCEKHPLFVQFLDLPNVVARNIIVFVIFVLGLAMAWRMRRRWALAGVDMRGKSTSALAPEWAVGCIFAAIIGPVAWHQHLVLALPCAYLVLRDTLGNEKRRARRTVALGVIVFFVWILRRDTLSKLHSLIALSYHFDVLVLLMLVTMTLAIEGAATSGRDSEQFEHG